MTKLTSFLIVSVLLIFAFVPRSLPAQATLPSTAAGAQLSAWLTAFDSHDRATLLAYLQKNAPDRVAHIDDELDFGRRTGGFDLRKVRDCDDTTCAALVQERNSDQFARANIEVDPAPPHLIKKLDIRAIPRPAEFPLPPFTEETARQKVQLAEDAWNTRDPERVAGAYTEDSVWRNRGEFITGRAAIIEFLRRKWARELDYALRKDLWSFGVDHIAVRFQYECHDADGQWFRSYGNELWEFDADGLMKRREASINDVPIAEADRRIFGPRPESERGQSFPLR